jgi:hypothetical protein
VAALGLLTIAAIAWQPVMSQEVRIQHVAIVSPERTKPKHDATVIVKDGRIAAILEGETARRSRGGCGAGADRRAGTSARQSDSCLGWVR